MLLTLLEKEETKQTREKELSRYNDSDPRVVAEKGIPCLYTISTARLVKLYKEAANRVTDNIWILHSYMTREIGIDRDVVNGQFEIDEDALEDMI